MAWIPISCPRWLVALRGWLPFVGVLSEIYDSVARPSFGMLGYANRNVCPSCVDVVLVVSSHICRICLMPFHVTSVDGYRRIIDCGLFRFVTGGIEYSVGIVIDGWPSVESSSSVGITCDGPCGEGTTPVGFLCTNVHFGCYAGVASSRLVRVAF